MKINFLKFSKVLFTFSIGVILLALVLFFVQDFKLGTDFKGGLEAEVQFSRDYEITEIQAEIQEDEIKVEVEKIVSKENSFFIRIPLLNDDAIATENYLVKALEDGFEEVTINQVQIIGAILSSQNRVNAIYVSLAVIALIMIYLTMRFRFRYGVAAIIAVVHDVLIVLFFVAVLGLEVNILVIVALLTIFGYSVNDTIVLFDRIRENISRDKHRSFSFKEVLNDSINQIISRTLITSLTTILVVMSLYLSTRGIYQEFALLLVIGVVSGTYSSIYIACSVLNIWNDRKPIKN